MFATTLRTAVRRGALGMASAAPTRNSAISVARFVSNQYSIGQSVLPLPNRFLLGAQRRFSTATNNDNDEGGSVGEGRVAVYVAPLGRPVRMLKMVSSGSCLLTLVFLPLSVFVGNPTMPMISKAVISGTVCSFALVTTALLHHVAKAYVRRIILPSEDAALFEETDDETTSSSHDDITDNDADEPVDPSQITVIAETTSFFGGTKETVFTLDEIEYPTDPQVFVSFRVRGEPFFMHPELVRDDPRLSWLFKQLI